MPRRPRRPPPDAVALAELAPLQVAAVADLTAAGLSSSTIARRVRSGRWQRPAQGVVVLHSGSITRDQQVRVALLRGRPDGVLSGVEAARRHGLRRLPDDDRLLVLVDENCRRRSSGLTVIERTSRRPHPVVRDGVPVAPFDRTLMDAARHTSDLDAVRAMIAEAVQRRLTTVARLTDELDAGNQRESGRPREVLDEADEGLRSAAEGWALDVYRDSDLPPVLWNPTLFLPNGRFLASPDGFFDDVGLAWEVNSTEFHPDGDDDTARRTADMVKAGVIVVGHRPRRLKAEPQRVVEEVWSYYLLAASRPRPDVRVVPAPASRAAA